MDWEKWRQRQDEQEADIQQVRELRQILGIDRLKPASRLAPCVVGIVIAVFISISVVTIPLIVERYQSGSSAWTAIQKGAQYVPYCLVPVLLIMAVNLWRKK